jgi:hypothetical protein
VPLANGDPFLSIEHGGCRDRRQDLVLVTAAGSETLTGYGFDLSPSSQPVPGSGTTADARRTLDPPVSREGADRGRACAGSATSPARLDAPFRAGGAAEEGPASAR